MSSRALVEGEERSGGRRLVVGLSGDGRFLETRLFGAVVREARAEGFGHVTLTGRAHGLHDDCAAVFGAVSAAGLTAGLVVDGEQFESAWESLAARREFLTHVCFRLRGADAEAHDGPSGAGSFRRMVSAFSRCRAAGVPFGFVFEVRRETLPELERAALFAARLGAAGLSFLLAPTPETCGEDTGGSSKTGRPGAGRPGPDESERRLAEQEVAALARVFRMPITLADGCEGADGSGACRAPGEPGFHLTSGGELALCLPAEGGRGGRAGASVDLRSEGFAAAFGRLRGLAPATPGGAAAGRPVAAG